MEGYIIGDLHENDIYDWIDRWHDRFEHSDVQLIEYLGMTSLEYGDWVSQRRTLKQIVIDRIPKKPGMVFRVVDRVFLWVMSKLLP